MLPGCRRTLFTQVSKAGWLISIILLICQTALPVGNTASRVLCREDLTSKHLNQLSDKLRKITGWTDLGFDQRGALQLGSADPVVGSKTARELLTKITTGTNVVIIEDASKRSDVVFCRVVPGKWKRDGANRLSAYVVLIDFVDFEQLMGDRRALEAFDVGWALLHEFEHVANDSDDPVTIGETGECEAQINQMRRECHLPERADYFFTPFPLRDSDFRTKLVRLSFIEETTPKNKKQYWVIWDTTLVGGADDKKQIAALR